MTENASDALRVIKFGRLRDPMASFVKAGPLCGCIGAITAFSCISVNQHSHKKIVNSGDKTKYETINDLVLSDTSPLHFKATLRSSLTSNNLRDLSCPKPYQFT